MSRNGFIATLEGPLPIRAPEQSGAARTAVCPSSLGGAFGGRRRQRPQLQASWAITWVTSHQSAERMTNEQLGSAI